MTEYAYKLVSMKLGGRPDWAAIKKAHNKGWEPVPLGEEPNPFPNPIGMNAEQMRHFKLCRMPLDKHTAMQDNLIFLNKALQNDMVHAIIAAGNIEKWIAEHSLTVEPQNLPENALEISAYNSTGGVAANGISTDITDPILHKQVRVAYEWLRARGMV